LEGDRVEAAAQFAEQAQDRQVAQGLAGVVDLEPGDLQGLFHFAVLLHDLRAIVNEERRAVFFSQFGQFQTAYEVVVAVKLHDLMLG